MLKFIEIFIKNQNKIISTIQLRLLGLNEIFVSPLTRFDVKGWSISRTFPIASINFVIKKKMIEIFND